MAMRKIILGLLILSVSSCDDGIQFNRNETPKECKKPPVCWYYWKGVGASVSEGDHGGILGPMKCGLNIGDTWIDADGMLCEITSEGHVLTETK